MNSDLEEVVGGSTTGPHVVLLHNVAPCLIDTSALQQVGSDVHSVQNWLL